MLIPTTLLLQAASASLGPEVTAPIRHTGFGSHSLLEPALPTQGWGRGTRDGTGFAAPQALCLHLCSKQKCLSLLGSSSQIPYSCLRLGYGGSRVGSYRCPRAALHDFGQG